MLHACVERFDVMGGRRNILGWEGEVNKALVTQSFGNDDPIDIQNFLACLNFAW
jgi:hypothetical protein